MYADQYHNAAMDLGLKLGKTRSEWEMRQEERRISGGDYNFKRLSLKTVIAKYLQRGVWLVRVQGHLLVVRGGKLVDRNWSRRAGLGRRVVDVVEVLNPHRPVIQGVIRVIRHNARKRGTGAHARFRHMTELVRLRPTITKEDLLKNSTYTEVDFAWDLQRGNIEII
jgi:hypothetical protein